MIEEHTANSVSEAWELLCRNTWDTPDNRYRSIEVFRGLSDYDYELTTSLIRLHEKSYTVEDHLIRNFNKYSIAEIEEQSSIWHLLSIAQHYGLPTRLLDWTFSPLVALHFTTADTKNYGKDGIVWCVNFEDNAKKFPKALRNILKRQETSLLTVEMLSEAYSTLEQFQKDIEKDIALFFEPPSIDQRIAAQRALFSILSSPQEPYDDWAERNNDVVRKIRIPKEIKWQIRDKLDQANINEKVLFPGLEGLCSWLSRHYLPKSE